MADAEYSRIVIEEKAMFLDPVKIPDHIKYKKEHSEDKCILTMYNVQDRLVKDIKRKAGLYKARYYANHTANNAGKIGVSVAKGLFKGIRGFAKGVGEGIEDVKKNY